MGPRGATAELGGTRVRRLRERQVIRDSGVAPVTVSQKHCADLFLSELRQISTDFNFWQVHGKMFEILRGDWCTHFPPHLICVATLPCKTQKSYICSKQWLLCQYYGKYWDNHFLSHDQAIQCSQQVSLLLASSCPVFDLKFSVKTSRSVTWWSKSSPLSKTRFWSPKICHSWSKWSCKENITGDWLWT